ncbi:replication protein A 70 kDa DNA-binding subunit B-like [Forsythia ovata]|uniref:Replication protein A 70 kDa DNA-binding subunit B-like n=1 Tax=Forsythia ovata TaxID=205694 RepID=A0ABD1T4E6_9LAMI
MSNEFQLIREVSPGTTGWTVKGSTVQATLYGQNITAFQDELILEKIYLISNALVKLTSEEYKAKSGEVQWTISGRTRIRLVEENNSNLLISTYSFTDFENLPKYMDSNIYISK